MSVTAKEGDKAAKKIVESETADDEMDKNITLRSSHIGYGVAGVGFILMLIAVAFFGISAAMVLNLLLGVFFLSAMTEACVSIYLYEIGDNRFKCDRDG
jgi:dipeptide/tripeptide permease